MNDNRPVQLKSSDFFRSDLYFEMYKQRLKSPISLHWHEFYELTLVIAGEGTNKLNGTEYPLRRGSLFLLTPADFHEITPESELELYNVIFTEKWMPDHLYRYVFDHPMLPQIQLTSLLKMMQADFEQMYHEYTQKLEGHEWMLAAALQRLLVQVVRSSKINDLQAMKPTAGTSQLQQALIYIEHHFRAPLTLKQVARQAHLSSNYFSHCFHREVGMTFQRFLQQKRLQFARSLLLASELSITEICFRSGFNTLQHFEKVFRQQYGAAPREYRKNSKTPRTE